MNTVKDNSKEQPEECQCCGFPSLDLVAYAIFQPSKYHNTSHKWLCDLCSSTMAGKAYEDPLNFPNQQHVLATICFVGNAVKNEVKGFYLGLQTYQKLCSEQANEIAFLKGKISGMENK